ncbi:hypothetical protein HJ581_0013210 [Rhodococcus opacus]|nr:hypothetical protein HJ581_0013210 [Rhodococcus opacus]
MAVSDRIESRTGVARICAAALFALAGVLFVVYPVVRPYAAGGAPDGRAEFASPWWLIAHLAAVGGFIAFGLALVALSGLLNGTGGERAAVVAVAASWIGTGLTLPYYGAETFALHALGGSGLDEGAVTTLAESVRMGRRRRRCSPQDCYSSRSARRRPPWRSPDPGCSRAGRGSRWRWGSHCSSRSSTSTPHCASGTVCSSGSGARSWRSVCCVLSRRGRR